jgi:excinuclease UvrABC helicase subunit UvrB
LAINEKHQILPSSYNNRPLRFEEFELHMKNAIFVSATPGDYELGLCPKPVELIIRPTELLDPLVEITDTRHIPKSEIPNVIIELEAEMREAAERLEFERAIQLRDTARRLEREILVG